MIAAEGLPRESDLHNNTAKCKKALQKGRLVSNLTICWPFHLRCHKHNILQHTWVCLSAVCSSGTAALLDETPSVRESALHLLQYRTRFSIE